ncbi:MAG: hypothetical protein AAB037_05160, partial [Chloroflexota bacterium]
MFTADGQRQEYSFATRVDPFTGNIAKIAQQRAARGIGINVDLDIRPMKLCEFCQYQEFTPQERIEHWGGAISVPNKYPWEKHDWITIYPPFGQHKLLLSDLYFEDLEAMMESSFDLAQLCSQDPEVIAFMDFTNWGAFAGASQQHPHSQRKSITAIADPVQSREWQRCQAIAKQHRRNPFDVLLDEEREKGQRLIYENEITILAAFAPTCPNEVLVFPNRAISHILQTTSEERRRLFRPVLGIFPALFFYHGVTDLNIAVHMAPYAQMEEARAYYRWHLHIYPRRSRLPMDKAGAELGFGTSIIDTLPEKTAEALRLWYRSGPQEEMVARRADGAPQQLLIEEFRRVTNN